MRTVGPRCHASNARRPPTPLPAHELTPIPTLTGDTTVLVPNRFKNMRTSCRVTVRCSHTASAPFRIAPPPLPPLIALRCLRARAPLTHARRLPGLGLSSLHSCRARGMHPPTLHSCRRRPYRSAVSIMHSPTIAILPSRHASTPIRPMHCTSPPRRGRRAETCAQRRAGAPSHCLLKARTSVRCTPPWPAGERGASRPPPPHAPPRPWREGLRRRLPPAPARLRLARRRPP
jgi:hypothetical protein